MADELGDAIRVNAQGPAKAAGDSGSMEQYKLPDQIAADRYRASKAAAKSRCAVQQVRAAGGLLMFGCLVNAFALFK